MASDTATRIAGVAGDLATEDVGSEVASTLGSREEAVSLAVFIDQLSHYAVEASSDDSYEDASTEMSSPHEGSAVDQPSPNSEHSEKISPESTNSEPDHTESDDDSVISTGETAHCRNEEKHSEGSTNDPTSPNSEHSTGTSLSIHKRKHEDIESDDDDVVTTSGNAHSCTEEHAEGCTSSPGASTPVRLKSTSLVIGC